MVEIQWHSVLGSTFQHSFIKITPEDQKYWRSYRSFFYSRIAKGKIYLTIGAASKKGFFKKAKGKLHWARIKTGLNRKTDRKKHSGTYRTITLPAKYANENKFIEAIIRQHQRYYAHEDYDTFPKKGSRSKARDGHNSNSYVAALILYSGATVPRITAKLPGLSKPLPRRCFNLTKLNDYGGCVIQL